MRICIFSDLPTRMDSFGWLKFSLLEKVQAGAVLSVVKQAEDEEALIVWFYNPSETDSLTADTLRLTRPVTEWLATGLDEAPLATPGQSPEQPGEFGRCQAKAYRVRF